MNDLISIVVPVYKVEKYLDMCINSIVNQTYFNLEIILVDDGSPDKCPVICDEWAKRDSRIKVIHKNNGGLSDARNKGLDNATGEYVMFVDSDDKIHPQMIEIMLEEMKNNNAEICVGSYRRIRLIDEQFQNINPYETKIISKNSAFMNFYSEKEEQFVTAWGKLYKRKLFKEIRFPFGKLYEDTYVTFMLYDIANKIIEIPLQFYYYLQRNDSIMGINNLSRYEDLYLGYFRRMEYFKKHNYNVEYETQRMAIEYGLHGIYTKAKNSNDFQNIKIARKFYKKYYFECFNTFSWKYKLVGFINLVFGNV